MSRYGYDPYNSIDAWRIRWTVLASEVFAYPGLRGLGLKLLP